MFPRLWKRSVPKAKPAAILKTDIEPYLPRLYVESRQALFRILLGEALPAQSPFPVDPEQTAEILHQIEMLILHDEHLEGCRERIGEHFPGRLAVLFNLARETDKLYPTAELRASIMNHVRRHQADLTGQALDLTDQAAIEELKGSSRLQQQLAYLVDYTPNKWLLEQEIPVVIASRRRRVKAGGAMRAAGAVQTDPAAKPPAEASFCRADDPYIWSRDKGRLSGLCFSGGGIRSATFNLGILQGLASKNLLRRFDYCSSVSGGGYIHQWLAAWVKREEAQHPGAQASPGLDAVCRQLIPLPDAGCVSRPAEPIRWLRRYSNYLTPRTGIFSADTWVTAATWMRNTFLNQIVLISCMVSVMLLPHLFLLPQISSDLAPIDASPSMPSASQSLAGISKAALLLMLVAVNFLIVVRNLAAGLNDARKGKTCDSRLDDKDLCLMVVLPSLFVSVAICDFGFYFVVPGLSEVRHATALCAFSFLGLFILSWALTWAGGAFERRPNAEDDTRYRRIVGFTLAAVLSALAGTGAILLTRNAFVTGNPFSFNPPAMRAAAPPVDPKVNVQVTTGQNQDVKISLQVLNSTKDVAVAHTHRHPEAEVKWRAVVTFGPLIVMMIPFIAVIFQTGLVGYDFPDWVLEWLARVRAWVAMYSIAWTLLVGMSLFGHQILDYVVAHGNKWISTMGVGSWLLTTIGSVLAGKSSNTSGEAGSNGNSRTLNLLIAAGPPVYILGLLLMVAWAAQEALYLAGISSQQEVSALQMTVGLAVVLLGPVATFLLFGWRVDVNEFSMHSYYRNRLARCYLGASNPTRDPDPLTGFDSDDVEGLKLSTFLPNQGYTGPMPVFCASINISVGEDLAWQERKAASFAFTPLLSGYHVPWTGRHYKGQLSYNGFVPTERFAYGNGGIHISTVAAISGAAVSPNAGYHTSKPMAFLLTMFNVRLGWWLPNPRRSFLAFDPKGQPATGTKAYPHPVFAPNQLLSELLGQIGDDRKFVYLTDGGHFDNMGLYEMVRRRCYEIVICDAEQDAGPVFEGIGMAIRKCRIDFGVEIELDLNKLATDAATKVSKVHWILGSIKYPETGDAKAGTILYIKSSITGNEAADVYNYRLQHAPFPQDSTLDQWFSESQFESYRRLGQQVVDVCPYL
jgi:hypothetical protein